MLDQLKPLFRAFVARGGKPFVVGGFVRDQLLGLEPKDIDIEVHGLHTEQVIDTLLVLGCKVDSVGQSFGVLKVRFRGLDLDVSLPRTERKLGTGHTGFAVTVDPFIGITKALARRDFTVNAMAWDVSGDTPRLIDPFDGWGDLLDRRLSAVGPAFVEDPLRVLRAVQFATRFGMTLEKITARICRELVESGQLDEISKERIWTEWEKIALKGKFPLALVRALEATGLQGRWGQIKELRAFPERGGLDQERATAIVLTALGVDADTLDIPKDITTRMKDIRVGLLFTGTPRESRLVARSFRRGCWDDVLRVDFRLTGRVDPWVQFEPLPLPVTGTEIMDALGIKPGPLVGRLIERARTMVDDSPLITAEELLGQLADPQVG